MGWIYYRTRSIWPCFLIHAFNNTTACIAANALPETAEETLGIPLSTGIPLIVVSLLLIALAARYIGKMTKDRTPIPAPVSEVLPPPLPVEATIGTPLTDEAVLGTPVPDETETDNPQPPEI